LNQHENPKSEPLSLASDLRRRAEKKLRAEPAELERIGSQSQEVKELLHELQVHQIELELQNEELRRAQLELAASHEKYFDLYDLAPVGYLTINETGLIQEANLTAANLLGVERSRLLKQPAARFIIKDDQNIYYRHRKQVLETRKPQVADLRMIRKSSPFWTRLESTLVLSAGDGLLFRTVISDITALKLEEEKRLEERRLQQGQRLETLRVLAGGIAHDFNNLLMAILGHADLAMEELPPLSPAKERIQKIKEVSRRASDLCLQMFAYTGTGRIEMKTVDLTELVEEMIHLLKTTIGKQVVFNLNLEPGPALIEADASQIRQIVMNLIINASEAIGDQDGVITVSVGARERDYSYLQETSSENNLPTGLYAHLEVSDTGCGMGEETRGRVFEPFFTTKFTGRGLGLAAVLGIVRTHKGGLKVRSKLGEGTTFTVLFPALRTQVEKEAEATKEIDEAWQGSGTLLLVDDEEIVRDVVCEMLEQLGFSILTAADGREALDLYRDRSREIAAIVLDMTMPHMSGEETFRQLRRLNPDVPVILSSGYAEQDVVSQFAGKGLSGFIQKPYTLDNLRTALRGLMSGVQPQRTA
jgi:PAS domain S-box-containing protein